MSFTIVLSSSNFNGQLGDITYFPESGGTIYLSTQTIPYTFVTDYYYGSYSIYFSSFDKTCYTYLYSGDFLLQENYSRIEQEDLSGILLIN